MHSLIMIICFLIKQVLLFRINTMHKISDYEISSTLLIDKTNATINFKLEENISCNLTMLTIRGKKHYLCLQLKYNNIYNSDKAKSTSTDNTGNINYNIDEYNKYLVNGFDIAFKVSSSVNGFIYKNRFFGRVNLNHSVYLVEPIFKYSSIMKKENVTDRSLALIFKDSNLFNTEKYFANIPSEMKHYRQKRSYQGNICPLLLLSDYAYFLKSANEDVLLAALQMLHHIDEVDTFFRNVDFNEDGIPSNIGFSVKYLIVIGSPDIQVLNYTQFLGKSVEPNKYLSSLMDLDVLSDVCLGIVFTAFPFENHVIGLSFTANDMVNNLGGICERPLSGIIHYNLMTVTSIVEDEGVPQNILQLAIAHELGHSFGSPHDESASCANYLMAPVSDIEFEKNNFEFSRCSKRKMRSLIEKKGHCFEKEQESFCGNGLIEKNEDCDCGLPKNCLHFDPCCYPRGSGKKACQVALTPKTQCHPSQGYCCTPRCTFKNLTRLGINCSEHKIICPCKNKTNCTCGFFGSCIDNECHSVECTRIGLRECNCTDAKINNNCHVCCALNNTCISSVEATHILLEGNKISLLQLKDYAKQNFKHVHEIGIKHCKKNECVIIFYSKWNLNDYCVYRGKVGFCSRSGYCHQFRVVLPKYTANLNVQSKSKSSCVSYDIFFCFYAIICLIIFTIMYF